VLELIGPELFDAVGAKVKHFVLKQCERVWSAPRLKNAGPEHWTIDHELLLERRIEEAFSELSAEEIRLLLYCGLAGGRRLDR
jgi:hypothetical protein